MSEQQIYHSVSTPYKLLISYFSPTPSPVIHHTKFSQGVNWQYHLGDQGPAITNSVTATKPKVVPPSRGKLAARLPKRVASSEEAFRGAFSSTGESFFSPSSAEKPELL